MPCHDRSGRPPYVARDIDSYNAKAEGSPEVSSRPDQLLLRILSLLSGDVRLRLLHRLADGPCSVSELAAHLHVSIALVSHNLRRLHEVGLVLVRPKARQRVYRLDGTMAKSEEGRLVIDLPLESGWQASLSGPAPTPYAPGLPATRTSTINQFLASGRPEASSQPPRHRSGPGE